MVCRCSGRVSSMVVWSQCRSILSNNTIPRDDVLLPPQSSESSGVFIPTFNHSLLVTDLHLHMGRTTSFVIYVITGLGTITWCCILHHADRSFMGRYAKRLDDFAWCLGSRS